VDEKHPPPHVCIYMILNHTHIHTLPKRGGEAPLFHSFTHSITHIYTSHYHSLPPSLPPSLSHSYNTHTHPPPSTTRGGGTLSARRAPRRLPKGAKGQAEQGEGAVLQGADAGGEPKGAIWLACFLFAFLCISYFIDAGKKREPNGRFFFGCFFFGTDLRSICIYIHLCTYMY
jgi:hypothetical protein